MPWRPASEGFFGPGGVRGAFLEGSPLAEGYASAAAGLLERYYPDAVSLKLQVNMSRGGGPVQYQVNVTEFFRAPDVSGG